MGSGHAGGQHDVSGSGEYNICLDGNPCAQADIGQDQWRWCKLCQLLCFDGKTSFPGGGAHISAGSGNYVLTAAAPPSPSMQSGWKWCNKFYGIAYANNPSNGRFPRGGTHNHGGSSEYSIIHYKALGPNEQDKWSWCSDCQQLWYSGNGDGGCCHAPMGGHTKAGSGKYVLRFVN